MLRKLTLTLIIILLSTCCSASIRADREPVYFLSLSDIHFDPFISCYGLKRNKTCPLIQELREASAAQWATILSRSDKSVQRFRMDSNYQLLISSLKAAHDAANAEHAKFVLVLGDARGHDFRRYYRKYAHDSSSQGYQAFVYKTIQFVCLELARAFPDMSVYSVIGNNDTYSRDYGSEINGQFFQDVSKIWSPLIKGASNRASMRATVPYVGYYAVDRPDLGLKIILLNSVIFSYKAKGSGIHEAASRQLIWLHTQLAAAKKNHQRVLIAMHIPVGVDVYAMLRTRLFTLVQFWKPEYAEAFKDDLDDYHDIIAGVFSGHMHSDWFQIMTFDDGGEIAITGTPSISPIFGNNPGFKIYEYSLKEKVISDFYTYYFPLNDRHVWSLEYEFDRIYQPNCHLCSLLDSIKKLKLTGKIPGAHTHA